MVTRKDLLDALLVERFGGVVRQHTGPVAGPTASYLEWVEDTKKQTADRVVALPTRPIPDLALEAEEIRRASS